MGGLYARRDGKREFWRELREDRTRRAQRPPDLGMKRREFEPYTGLRAAAASAEFNTEAPGYDERSTGKQ